METVPFNGLNGSGSSLPRSFVFLSKVPSHKSLSSSSAKNERRENFRFRYTAVLPFVDRFVTRIGIIWKRKRKRRGKKGEKVTERRAGRGEEEGGEEKKKKKTDGGGEKDKNGEEGGGE